LAAVAVAVVVVGCSRGAEPPAIAVPARAATAGDALLALAPGGATWTLELDLARLRANPVVGATVAALVDGEATAPLPEVASARGAEQVVLVGYASGSPAAHTITLVRGGVAPAAAVAVADGVWAIADEGAVAGLVAVAPGASAADDVELAVVRSRAMPAGAEGAALRLAARLDDDARRALGAALELTEPPRALSAWLDVADDRGADRVAGRRRSAGPGRVARSPGRDRRGPGAGPGAVSDRRGDRAARRGHHRDRRDRAAPARARGRALASWPRGSPMTALVVVPTGQPLSGEVVAPGDKSIGHRALLFSALSPDPGAGARPRRGRRQRPHRARDRRCSAPPPRATATT
jgi:hypothetical protein